MMAGWMHWDSAGEKTLTKSLFEILHVVFQENKHKGHDFGQE